MHYCFPRSSIKFKGHTGQKNRQFWPKLSVSGLWLQFEFTNGFEMMHKAWCSIDEVPYYHLRSSIKFQGYTGWKIDGSNLSMIIRPVAAIKSLRFALFWIRLRLLDGIDNICMIFSMCLHTETFSSNRMVYFQFMYVIYVVSRQPSSK